MKPKTKIQKEVARLSANLRPISATQIDWAYRHCVEHIGYRTKKGNITCSDCGHEWHSDSGLCDTLEGCTCPKCHAELKVQDTRRRIYKETQNFSVITTCKGYQVIRVAQVRCESRKGEPMRFYCHEVVQRWISPDGKVTDMALLRGFLFCYCDVWALGSDMEVRPHNSLYDDVVARSCAYPKMRILPQLRRNGFKGDFHGISPVRLFKALLSDPRIETLMKGGEIEVMKHFLFNTRTADECWASYLIAKRHKYQIDNLSMWCDYLRMLKKLGQDLRNPKNICPEDFMAAHDNATRKIEAIHEKERAAEQRRWEIERREREQQRQLQRKKDAEDFIANKSKFFGLVITDEEIIVKVLESIDEYYNEGKTQGICVFGSGYYKKADTLILSARIGDEIIETVEVDLRTLEVVQCHGKHNQDTEYHERIIDLVNSGANLRADVLQVGHHGSSTSTSYLFLNAVLPEMGIISCGVNNKYGHPHEETLSILRDAGVDVYRTDLQGTITIGSDGQNYTVGTEHFAADSALNPTDPAASSTAQQAYIGNVNSKKFHLPTCPNLPAEKNQVLFSSYEEAVEAGYTPCSSCIK